MLCVSSISADLSKHRKWAQRADIILFLPWPGVEPRYSWMAVNHPYQLTTTDLSLSLVLSLPLCLSVSVTLMYVCECFQCMYIYYVNEMIIIELQKAKSRRAIIELRRSTWSADAAQEDHQVPPNLRWSRCNSGLASRPLVHRRTARQLHSNVDAGR